MKKLSFIEMAKAVNVIMQSEGCTPFVYGHAGIGKSQLAATIVNAHCAAGDPMKLEIIYGSVIGEKELGGIPTRADRTLKPSKKEIEDANGDLSKIEKKTVKVNEYTVHDTILRVINNDRAGYKTLLFIDELNRCERAVQNELMQLILDRRINNIHLPDTCFIVAAGNLESDDVADYQVNIMNDALKDRFWQAEMEADIKDWLRWALANDKNGQQNVDSDVIDYLSEYPENFMITEGDADIKPNPRSWDMLSREKRTLGKIGKGDETNILSASNDTLYYMACGHVGDVIGHNFITFLKEKKNPMVKPEEIFDSSDEKFAEVKDKLRKEAIPRLTVTITRMSKYAAELIPQKKFTKKHVERIIGAFSTLPKDLMLGCIQDIGHNYKKLHDKLVDNDEYMDLYFDVAKMIRNQAK